MDIKEYRSEFVIFVVDADTKTNSKLKEILEGVNFQVEIFATAALLLSRLSEAPPHIIFSGVEIDLIDRVKSMSPDIEIIYFGKKSDGLEAIRHGAFAFIEKPFSEAELLSTADRLVEHIFLRLQNEQLIEELNQKGPNETASPPSLSGDYVAQLVDKTANLDDPDRVARFVAEEISHLAHGRPVIFLKYLPAHKSLMTTASAQIPLDDLRTVGIKLDHYDEKNISFLLGAPEEFKELKEMMSELFKCTSFSAFPLRIENKAVGIFAVFQSIKEQEELANKVLALGALGYQNAVLKNKVKDLAIRDYQTGLFNRRYFNEKLDEEMNRARRTHYPLSLVHIDIDQFKKYNDIHGHIMGDIIIKSVAQIILKTSRKTDIAVRLGGEEFAILCPATSGVGAAIKAEKIRLTVEATKFPQTETSDPCKITVSAGVSEYPTIVSDALTLFRAADDALFKVKQGGRNRVCLSEAPTNFKPDFEPLPMPGFQALPPNQIQT